MTNDEKLQKALDEVRFQFFIALTLNKEKPMTVALQQAHKLWEMYEDDALCKIVMKDKK